ncbi:MAG TPA: hypothetical protein PLO61_00460 [Fimbriimonadaceae bacterium]|nr:hypothetical protein [Fimbriimonadaceae bacterium]HRJ32369.1 hypothetical protein [Fimbriimonadaceae bacterium]
MNQKLRLIAGAAFVFMVGSIGLTGCRKDPPVEVRSADPSGPISDPRPDAAPQPGADPGADPGTDPGTAPPETAGPKSPPGPSEEPKAPPPSKVLPPVIPPKTQGWSQAQLSPTELGNRVDQALRNLNSAWVDAQLIVASPSVTGSAQMIGRFKDARNYYAEYLMPTDPTRMSIVRSGEQGTKMVEAGATVALDKAKSPSVESFPVEFPRALVLPIARGATPWRDLLAAWGRGQGQYKLSVEEKNYEVQGRQIRMVRAVAETQKGPPTRIEIRFDATRFVPVFIRVDQKTARGDASSQWNGGWRFNQAVDLTEEGLAKSRPRGQQ